MPYNIIFMFVYFIFMFLIVFYFLHSASVLSFYIDVVLTFSILIGNPTVTGGYKLGASNAKSVSISWRHHEGPEKIQSLQDVSETRPTISATWHVCVAKAGVLLNSFTVSPCTALTPGYHMTGAVSLASQWLLRNCGNSQRSHEPTWFAD